MPKDTGLDDAEKGYLSELHEKYSGKEIVDRFQKKYGWVPDAEQINECKGWKKVEPEPEHEDDEGLEIETEDTRKQKGIVDFSSGEMPDKEFDELVKNVGHSKQEVFELLKEAFSKGYKKVDIKTGELSK